MSEEKTESLLRRMVSVLLLGVGSELVLDGLADFYVWSFYPRAYGGILPLSTDDLTGIRSLVGLTVIVIPYAITWGGAVLWRRWRTVLGLCLIVYSVPHIIPTNPLVFTHGIIRCQVGCRLIGITSLVVGSILIACGQHKGLLEYVALSTRF